VSYDLSYVHNNLEKVAKVRIEGENRTYIILCTQTYNSIVYFVFSTSFRSYFSCAFILSCHQWWWDWGIGKTVVAIWMHMLPVPELHVGNISDAIGN